MLLSRACPCNTKLFCIEVSAKSDHSPRKDFITLIPIALLSRPKKPGQTVDYFSVICILLKIEVNAIIGTAFTSQFNIIAVEIVFKIGLIRT